MSLLSEIQNIYYYSSDINAYLEENGWLHMLWNHVINEQTPAEIWYMNVEL